MSDGCTVGTTPELLSFLQDAWGLSGKSGMRCQSNTQRHKLSSPRELNLISRLIIHAVSGGCARWGLGRCVFFNQQNAGHESNRRNSSICILSSHLHLHSLFHLYLTLRLHPQLPRHYVTSTKQYLAFENTPDSLHNFVRSLWACFRYMQLYHNANASHVDSFSTHSDVTKGQPQREGEGNC